METAARAGFAHRYPLYVLYLKTIRRRRGWWFGWWTRGSRGDLHCGVCIVVVVVVYRVFTEYCFGFKSSYVSKNIEIETTIVNSSSFISRHKFLIYFTNNVEVAVRSARSQVSRICFSIRFFRSSRRSKMGAKLDI